MENLDFLEEILMTSSPSGDTKVVMEKVRKIRRIRKSWNQLH